MERNSLYMFLVLLVGLSASLTYKKVKGLDNILIPQLYDTPIVIDMGVIALIESSNNPRAVSKKGAIGLYQIMPVVLLEYNKFNNQELIANHLFNPDINKKVAVWYMSVRVPQLLKAFSLPITTDNVLLAYHSGVGNLNKGNIGIAGREYIRKYNKYTEEKNND